MLAAAPEAEGLFRFVLKIFLAPVEETYMRATRSFLVFLLGLFVLTGCDMERLALVPEGAKPPPAFGAQYHGLWGNWDDNERAAVLDELAASGATWIRMDIGWQTLQELGPDHHSEWYIDHISRWVDEARARGLNVLGTFWATPGWAGGHRSAAPDPDQYARAAQFVAGELRGRVSAWQVWNEPNHPSFYSGTATDYAALVRAAYPAFKAGDPDALVVVGGPSYNDTPWLSEVYTAGISGAYDVMSTHPYMGPADLPPDTPDTGTIWTINHVRAVHDLMVRNGDGHLPIWFTEFGWSTHANTPDTPSWNRGVTAQQQADYLVDALELIRTEHPYVTHAFWYTARDRDDSNIQVNNYGLMTVDLAAKPALEAVRDYLDGF